jgi:hypothetical protein
MLKAIMFRRFSAALVFALLAASPLPSQLTPLSLSLVQTKPDAAIQYDPSAGPWAIGLDKLLSAQNLRSGVSSCAESRAGRRFAVPLSSENQQTQLRDSRDSLVLKYPNHDAPVLLPFVRLHCYSGQQYPMAKAFEQEITFE